ncbi:hypothetical protein M2171_002433 [Bradyrhizobium japonicum USDA 38]|uniref:hypothetical protein n=1 Tax=Bradyrhizobium japonicum TaxID=375 RepID=UPI00041E7245|nr:hypothetical protein [Bradyrhizobium japonicum]MCS3893300.1 hypothetical protein [Bradyrhizobium japonicum USDA 38]MCS3945814.1 hypothetical protein [Bradyrhizobium japonicum]
MTAFLLGFAALALLVVVAGELSEMPWRRRMADAGRARLPAPDGRRLQPND